MNKQDKKKQDIVIGSMLNVLTWYELEDTSEELMLSLDSLRELLGEFGNERTESN